MVDIEFVGQLIHSMDDAVSRLEKAVAENKISDANKLRTFIFDLHRQVEDAMMNKNV